MTLIQKSWTRIVGTVVLALVSAKSAQTQTQRDVLAGHITGPNGPVPGATVSVLAANAPAGTFAQTARTDSEGRWLVAVQEGTGDYVVRVTAIGMVPKSVTAKRGEARKPIIVDVKMEQAVVELGPVRRWISERDCRWRPREPRRDGGFRSRRDARPGCRRWDSRLFRTRSFGGSEPRDTQRDVIQ